MYGPGEVPVISIIFMLISAVLAIGVPVGYLIWFRRKTKASMVGVLIGVLIFIGFVVAEKLIQSGVISTRHAMGRYILENPLLLSIIAALFPGVFEEVGRFVGFHLLKKKHSFLDFMRQDYSLIFGL